MNYTLSLFSKEGLCQNALHLYFQIGSFFYSKSLLTQTFRILYFYSDKTRCDLHWQVFDYFADQIENSSKSYNSLFFHFEGNNSNITSSPISENFF